MTSTTDLDARDQRRLDEACRPYGITRAVLARYLRGSSRPAPWLARELAAAVGRQPWEVFPNVERATSRPAGVHRR